jgi:stage V sporulation protein SpoVS
MSAARSTNVVTLPGAGLMAGLDEYIRARVKAEVMALGIGAVQPTRAQLRIRAGFLSQRDLETAAQLGRGFLTQYERGRVSRSGMGSRNRAGLDRICAALHCTAEEYILARTED